MTGLSPETQNAGQLLRRSGGLAEAVLEAADAASMIAIIRTHLTPYRASFEAPLRRFAWQCAYDVAHFTRGPAHDVLLEAGRLAAGLGASSYLLAAREAARAEADAARAVGMPRCEPSAAAFLAAFHSCAANVFDAARQAAECAAKVTFFRQARMCAKPDSRGLAEATWEESRRVADWLKQHRPELDGAETDVKRRQADLLRALLDVAPARVLPFTPSLLHRVRTSVVLSPCTDTRPDTLHTFHFRHDS